MARKAKFTEAREQSLPPLRPLTPRQDDYIKAIHRNDQVVVTGCAGTGKTYIAACVAADMLRTYKVKKIILTRPNVPGGRSLGFFPGSLEEKIAPWVVPFTSVIEERMGKGAYESALQKGNIEIVPFEVMRGRTFSDAFVILDEAQNTTPHEIKMFLTRIGEGTKLVVNGDIAQSDLKETSGLAVMLKLIGKYHIPVPHIEFTEEDIVRSDLCAQWVKAFHRG